MCPLCEYETNTAENIMGYLVEDVNTWPKLRPLWSSIRWSTQQTLESLHVGIVNLEPESYQFQRTIWKLDTMRQKALWWQEIQKTEYYCDKCEKRFFLSKDIICVYKKQKYSCTKYNSCLLPLMNTKLTQRKFREKQF